MKSSRTNLALRCAIAVAIASGLTLAAQSVQAQTYSVLYSFTGGADGYGAYSPLTLDAAGNLYGTTIFSSAGASGNGVIFKVSP